MEFDAFAVIQLEGKSKNIKSSHWNVIIHIVLDDDSSLAEMRVLGATKRSISFSRTIVSFLFILNLIHPSETRIRQYLINIFSFHTQEELCVVIFVQSKKETSTNSFSLLYVSSVLRTFIMPFSFEEIFASCIILFHIICLIRAVVNINAYKFAC